MHHGEEDSRSTASLSPPRRRSRDRREGPARLARSTSRLRCRSKPAAVSACPSAPSIPGGPSLTGGISSTDVCSGNREDFPPDHPAAIRSLVNVVGLEAGAPGIPLHGSPGSEESPGRRGRLSRWSRRTFSISRTISVSSAGILGAAPRLGGARHGARIRRRLDRRCVGRFSRRPLRIPRVRRSPVFERRRRNPARGQRVAPAGEGARVARWEPALRNLDRVHGSRGRRSPGKLRPVREVPLGPGSSSLRSEHRTRPRFRRPSWVPETAPRRCLPCVQSRLFLGAARARALRARGRNLTSPTPSPKRSPKRSGLSGGFDDRGWKALLRGGDWRLLRRSWPAPCGYRHELRAPGMSKIVTDLGREAGGRACARAVVEWEDRPLPDRHHPLCPTRNPSADLRRRLPSPPAGCRPSSVSARKTRRGGIARCVPGWWTASRTAAGIFRNWETRDSRPARRSRRTGWRRRRRTAPPRRDDSFTGGLGFPCFCSDDNRRTHAPRSSAFPFATRSGWPASTPRLPPAAGASGHVPGRERSSRPRADLCRSCRGGAGHGLDEPPRPRPRSPAVFGRYRLGAALSAVAHLMSGRTATPPRSPR